MIELENVSALQEFGLSCNKNHSQGEEIDSNLLDLFVDLFSKLIDFCPSEKGPQMMAFLTCITSDKNNLRPELFVEYDISSFFQSFLQIQIPSIYTSYTLNLIVMMIDYSKDFAIFFISQGFFQIFPIFFDSTDENIILQLSSIYSVLTDYKDINQDIIFAISKTFFKTAYNIVNNITNINTAINCLIYFNNNFSFDFEISDENFYLLFQLFTKTCNSPNIEVVKHSINCLTQLISSKDHRDKDFPIVDLTKNTFIIIRNFDNTDINLSIVCLKFICSMFLVYQNSHNSTLPLDLIPFFDYEILYHMMFHSDYNCQLFCSLFFQTVAHNGPLFIQSLIVNRFPEAVPNIYETAKYTPSLFISAAIKEIFYLGTNEQVYLILQTQVIPPFLAFISNCDNEFSETGLHALICAIQRFNNNEQKVIKHAFENETTLEALDSMTKSENQQLAELAFKILEILEFEI